MVNDNIDGAALPAGNRAPLELFQVFQAGERFGLPLTTETEARNFCAANQSGGYHYRRYVLHDTPGAQEPRAGWCKHCGEGVTDFCRDKTITPPALCPSGLRTLKRSPAVGAALPADTLAAALAKGYGGSTMASAPDGGKLCIYYDKREDAEAAHDALAKAMDAAADASDGPEPERYALDGATVEPLLFEHSASGAQPPAKSALDKFNAHAADLECESPLERLRYFLSHALSGQDWLDVEPFLDALGAAAPQEDTLGIVGADGKKHHLFHTRAEEDAAVARSPLAVASSLITLAERVGAVLPLRQPFADGGDQQPEQTDGQ